MRRFSSETNFPENQIKKIIIDLKKDFGYKLSKCLIIDNKINLLSNNTKEIFIQKCFQRNYKKLVFFQ